jgi:hypothetical protein
MSPPDHRLHDPATENRPDDQQDTDRTTDRTPTADKSEAASTTTAIKVYVRLGAGGDDNVREVSFRIPEGINPIDLIDRGIAVDGNQAVFAVAWNRADEAFDSPFAAGPSLLTALAASQRALVAYLRERGFEPQFT